MMFSVWSSRLLIGMNQELLLKVAPPSLTCLCIKYGRGPELTSTIEGGMISSGCP